MKRHSLASHLSHRMSPAKKKEKVHRTKLDPHDFFQPPPREEEEAVEGVAEAEEEAPSTPPTNSTDAVPTTPETKPPAPKPAAKPKVAPKAKAPLPPSKWGKVEGAAEESPDEAVGPSLQLAAAVAATEAPAAAKPQGVPPPKKKEKKKFTKMAVSDLGFDANNPNYR
eukprot:g15070.t2